MSTDGDGLLQRAQDVFDHVTIYDLVGDICQLAHRFDVCLFAVETAVAAGREIDAELLFREFLHPHVVGAGARLNAQAALRAAVAAEGLGGLLVTHLPNIRYLTGFTGSAALLVVHDEATVLVTDFRYEVQAPAEAGDSARVEVDQTSVWNRLSRVLAGLPQGALGIEAQSVTVKDAERIAGLTRSRAVPTTDLVERLRAVKSPEEVTAIRAAAELAQESLAEVLPTVRVGQTEREIGAVLEGALR